MLIAHVATIPHCSVLGNVSLVFVGDLVRNVLHSTDHHDLCCLNTQTQHKPHQQTHTHTHTHTHQYTIVL